MGRKNNSFPATRGRFFCKWRKRRACTLRAFEMMKKGCWRRPSGTLPGFHKNFSPKNAVRCMWLRSTLRWLSQHAASVIAARCIGLRSAMGLMHICAWMFPEFASLKIFAAVACAYQNTFDRQGRRASKPGKALYERNAIFSERNPHSLPRARADLFLSQKDTSATGPI